VFLSKPGAESQHELNAFELAEPVAQSRRDLASVRRNNANWTRYAQLPGCQGTIAIQRAIAKDRAQLEILGQEQHDRNAVSGIGSQLRRQLFVNVAINNLH